MLPWQRLAFNNSFKIDPDTYNEIKNTQGVSDILKRIQTGALSSNNDLSKFVYITGVQLENENKLTDWGKRLIDGELFQKNSNSIIN